jgi:hypothetical protein
MRILPRSSLILLVIFLLVSVTAGVASEKVDRFYSHWSGEIRFPVTEEFLRRTTWDFRPNGTPEALARPDVLVSGDPGAAAKVLEVEPLGAGSIVVPAGEFRGVLRRERVQTDEGIAVQYRWIGPGNTTLALVRGPVGEDKPAFTTASLVERLEAGTPEVGIRIYRDQFITPDTFDRLTYGLDVTPSQDPNVTTPLAGMTTQGYATGSALATATTWDFTPVLSLPNAVIAQTDVPVTAGESCNSALCGFSFAGTDFMSRQDNLSSGSKTVAAFDINATGDAVFLRAGSQYEGTNAESRFCYDGLSDRGEVPQYKFQNPDAGRFFMQLGDPHWEGTTWSCDINLFNTNCGAPEPFPKPVDNKVSPCSTYTGRFNFDITSEGTVKLPSGHWADVLILRQVADFCVFLSGGSCGFAVQNVRQPVVLFMSPTAGTMVQVNGPLVAADFNSWTGVNESIVQFGLLPPLSIQVDAMTQTTVSLSWNPGNQLGFVDRAKVYWDTDSGGATPYAFNSDANPGQVAFGTNSATISGLTPGQTYFFTVTLLDSFTEPGSSPVLTLEYESYLYPAGFSGNGITYPAQVQATTNSAGCTPTGEVQNLRVDYAAATDQLFTWDDLVDPCRNRYDLLVASSPTAAANFTTLNETATTSYTGDPPVVKILYFLVVAEGASGQRGPLGHYGQ